MIWLAKVRPAAGKTVSPGVVRALPDSRTTVGVPAALFRIDIVALKLWKDVGVNVTGIVVELPGGTVNGSETLPIWNTFGLAPPSVMLETTRSAVPELLIRKLAGALVTLMA